MSTALSIDGKNLVPIKDVVGSTEYTRDYVAKLAREGSIVAAQIGRQWYVDPISLENFKAASELESQVRRRHLSLERRRERDLKQEVLRHFDIVAVKRRTSRMRAVAQSALILVVGLSTGYFMFALSHLGSGVMLVQKAQTFVLSGIAQEDVPAVVSLERVPDVVGSTSILEQVTFSSINEVSVLEGGRGVLVLPSNSTASSMVAIEQLFSDPVQIVSETEAGGQLILGLDAATRTVPYIVVPVAGTTTDVAVVPQGAVTATP